MAKLSAGIVLYRTKEGALEVFLVHPGGPFWKNKDLGSWSIPKGEYEPTEDALTVAQREFEEEVGCTVPPGNLVPLGEIKQPSGKVVTAWALEGDCAVEAVHSNTFTLEWPPKSGKLEEFPEVDRAEWFTYARANEKILPGQRGFLATLAKLLGHIPELPNEIRDIPKQGSLF
jgi:predicted NUDIX family NTP pyrophosphohydrolase